MIYITGTTIVDQSNMCRKLFGPLEMMAMSIMGDSHQLYTFRKRRAGRPSGRGNNTTPPTYIKPKKKVWGSPRLTKKQRRKNG